MENNKLNIYKKLLEVQEQLKAPKRQWNKFGEYYFRSSEDILEAVKPLLKKYDLLLTLKDSVEMQGDRYYIKAIATVVNVDDEKEISVEAYARESIDKKKMDDSQITGTASSYARKYALNGLFLIDDTKDADTDEYKKTTQVESGQVVKNARKQKEVTKEITLEYAKTYVLPAGKYKRKTLDEINKIDRQYLNWYLKNGNNTTIKKCVELILESNDDN